MLAPQIFSYSIVEYPLLVQHLVNYELIPTHGMTDIIREYIQVARVIIIIDIHIDSYLRLVFFQGKSTLLNHLQIYLICQ